MKEQLETVLKSFNNRYLYTKDSALYIKLQDGSVGDNGVNGLQIDDVIILIAGIIAELDKKVTCRENLLTLMHLDEAYNWQLRRKADREFRKVEGTDKP
jgi:hypothetical protein